MLPPDDDAVNYIHIYYNENTISVITLTGAIHVIIFLIAAHNHKALQIILVTLACAAQSREHNDMLLPL